MQFAMLRFDRAYVGTYLDKYWIKLIFVSPAIPLNQTSDLEQVVIC